MSLSMVDYVEKVIVCTERRSLKREGAFVMGLYCSSQSPRVVCLHEPTKFGPFSGSRRGQIRGISDSDLIH